MSVTVTFRCGGCDANAPTDLALLLDVAEAAAQLRGGRDIEPCVLGDDDGDVTWCEAHDLPAYQRPTRPDYLCAAGHLVDALNRLEEAPVSLVCQHGSLARCCLVCELQADLAAARRAMRSTRWSLTEQARSDVHLYLACELEDGAAAREWVLAAMTAPGAHEPDSGALP